MRPHPAGAAVVVEVRTGRLLALYSKPDFDPNDLSGGSGRARIRDEFARLDQPTRCTRSSSKTMTGAFQPGSDLQAVLSRSPRWKRTSSTPTTPNAATAS